MTRKIFLLLFCLTLALSSCDKNPAGTPPATGSNEGRDNDSSANSGSMFQPIEENMPQGDQDPGFFLDNWQSKTIAAPNYQEKTKPSGNLDSRIQVDVDNVITKVPDDVYGNNTNPFNTQMADQPKLVRLVKDLNPHLIRGPGGSLSDVYFWNSKPGHIPADVPPVDSVPNSGGGYWYGKNQAEYTQSLESYYNFLDKTNSSGVLTVNFAYARYGLSKNPIARAAHYAADWVRHDNGRTKFWEIGNENYGTFEAGYQISTSLNKDNQPKFLTGKLYGNIAKVYIDSMRAAADEIGAHIKIGAVLYQPQPSTTNPQIERNWNSGYFKTADNIADFYIVHNYYGPYHRDSPPSVILHSARNSTKQIMDWMNTTTQQNNVELKPIALSEWNISAEGSQQKVSNVAGIHAAMMLGNIIKYRFGMACRWDLANAWEGGHDHGVFNSARSNQSSPDESDWNPRPSFYHMYYFQHYFGDRMVWSGTQGDKALKSYATIFSSGQVGLVVANTSHTKKVFDVQFKKYDPGNRYYWYTLKPGNGSGQFSRKVQVNGQGPSGAAGGPANYQSIKAYSAPVSGQDNLKLAAPPYSVLYILIDHGES